MGYTVHYIPISYINGISIKSTGNRGTLVLYLFNDCGRMPVHACRQQICRAD